MKNLENRNKIKYSEVKLREYQNKNAIMDVIGCLLNNPQLLKTYRFNITDFVESFHQMLYVTIHDMAREGVAKIDAFTVDMYLKDTFPYKYNIFTKHQGVKYLQTASATAIPENFENSYNTVRKWALIRELIRAGVNVSEYYDPDETDADLIEYKAERMKEDSIEDITNFYRSKILSINNIFNARQGRDSVKAGSEEAEAQKEAWKDSIDYGLSYASNYLNTVTYGIRRKRFTVMSAGTGVGEK